MCERLALAAHSGQQEGIDGFWRGLALPLCALLQLLSLCNHCVLQYKLLEFTSHACTPVAHHPVLAQQLAGEVQI